MELPTKDTPNTETAPSIIPSSHARAGTCPGCSPTRREGWQSPAQNLGKVLNPAAIELQGLELRGSSAAETATALPGAGTAWGRVRPPAALSPSHRCCFTARTEQTEEEQPRASPIPNLPLPWAQAGTKQQPPAPRSLPPLLLPLIQFRKNSVILLAGAQMLLEPCRTTVNPRNPPASTGTWVFLDAQISPGCLWPHPSPLLIKQLANSQRQRHLGGLGGDGERFGVCGDHSWCCKIKPPCWEPGCAAASQGWGGSDRSLPALPTHPILLRSCSQAALHSVFLCYSPLFHFPLSLY